MQSQTGTTLAFALDKISPMHIITTFSHRGQKVGTPTNIHSGTSGERSAPGRVDNIGNESRDEQPAVLRGEALELRTRARGEHTAAPN